MSVLLWSFQRFKENSYSNLKPEHLERVNSCHKRPWFYAQLGQASPFFSSEKFYVGVCLPACWSVLPLCQISCLCTLLQAFQYRHWHDAADVFCLCSCFSIFLRCSVVSFSHFNGEKRYCRGPVCSVLCPVRWPNIRSFYVGALHFCPWPVQERYKLLN